MVCRLMLSPWHLRKVWMFLFVCAKFTLMELVNRELLGRAVGRHPPKLQQEVDLALAFI